MQKVSLAMRAIGRPAHSSEIAATYKSMFPDEQTKERNIYAILTRKQCGVVGSGSRGIYALNWWRQTDQSADQKIAKNGMGHPEGRE